MKIKNKYIFVIVLTLTILGSGRANAQQDLAQEAYAIFQQNCLNCHGASGSFKEALLIDRTALVDTGAVIPGDPEGSEFYKRLLGPTENGPQMPLNLPPLSPEAIETIARWITAGAPDWDVQHDTNFITTDTILDTIRTHLESLDPFDRPSARYFTMTHLYNAGESPETLSDYRIALSKLVNSLSWKFEITNPTPIDTAQTIFYIDLRRYEWNNISADVWTHIEQAYPYNIAFDPETQAGLLEKLAQLQTETSSTVPFVHVDWFLATAALPPLYHDILGLPQTDRLLEAQLEVNVASNIRNAPGIDVWRAGFNDSGVSTNNRVVERHTSRYGAYWKSYDFAGSAGSQNIFTHPLDFTHDGGEIIFNLPNGLQAYLLVDANGNRLNDAPIKIVSNPAAGDPTVRNGLSCIGCHTQGMKKFKDSVRAAIEQDQNPPYNKEQALRLYPEQLALDALVQKDTLRFQQALEKIGGPFADDTSRQHFFKKHENEPVQRFHEAFQAPLDASHAAAAVGLETAEFLTQIREKQSLKNLGLQTLIDVNGTVKRDAWTSNFDDVISALNTPDSVLPPVVQRPERIPGETVNIPDPNLRAAIEVALGKAPNGTITVEDMETLTWLDAEGMDIQNLEGLQGASNLEELRLRGNSLADLSPLAGLITLKEVEISGEPLSDLSPLAGLINLEGVGFWKTSISDLSPLTELTKLRWLEFKGSPVSDLSPLAGLTNLKRLETYASKDLDLLPLKGLTNLIRLGVTSSGVSDISPLSELINLEWLSIQSNYRISDISALASLKKLKEVNLARNKISDVSPLAGLHNLEQLQLQSNNILDISPLDGLPENTEIYWFDNPGFPQGGPKIEGPWLWVLVPGAGFGDGVDLLSKASDGAATELAIATSGATEGSPIGENVWTSHKIAPTEIGNINTMLSTIGMEKSHRANVIYGVVTLYAPREQQTMMFAGADGGYRVWLNGEFLHKNPVGVWAFDYQDFFPVTLKQGANVLLVGVYGLDHWDISGYFGFAPEAEYAVVAPGTGISLSTDATSVRVGDRFTIRVDAEKVTDLAGWQFDLAFDPHVLEVVEVNEGGFLKTGIGTTFFQEGTIDNVEGEIVDIGAALISPGGVTGTGTLLSIVCSAKADGNSQLMLRNFQLGSSAGKVIPAVVHDFTITVEAQPTWDVNMDGQINIFDLILITQDFGEAASGNSRTDVNRDGVVNILDLILVAQYMGESTVSASPSVLTMDNIGGLDPTMIQAWIAQAQLADDGSLAFQQGIANLERLLTLFIPEKTVLLHNYPNPFNPETWIPYHLANSSDVTITIYNTRGFVVRQLNLGHQREGYYTGKSRAAYWDGRNAVGERVASGIYFYQLQADNLSFLRKMLILQ